VDQPQDPWERAVKRIAADRGRAGTSNTLARPHAAHLAPGDARVLLLWITEIPVRYSDINALPVMVIRAIWFLQAPDGGCDRACLSYGGGAPGRRRPSRR
jgi:hypothetical protein